MNNNYDTMTKEQLIKECSKRDNLIKNYKDRNLEMLTKKDVMKLFCCENDKALKILKVMYQMGYGNKIGKEYYVSRDSQENFIRDMMGKEVVI